MTTQFSIDQLVKVECYNHLKSACEWLLGNVTGIVSATDRDYRVNVILQDGREIDACAPECIKPYMRAVKVTFANSDTITTDINGTDEDIKHYYRVGRLFNIGSVEDNMQPVKNVEIIY